VLDTNVLVAGLRSRLGASSVLVTMAFERFFEVHISLPLWFQYMELLQRHQQQIMLTPGEISTLLLGLGKLAHFHEIYFLWRDVLPDQNDAALLELAIAARATHIVTFNIKHFIGCERFGIRVVSPLQFLRELET
jgi:putative PIN family toxin of toxin-antitoxin system